MGIPPEDINRVKTEISIVDLIRESGVVLKKQGDNYIGLCPFHNDKSPSLVVTPHKNLFHCLGFCDFGGDNYVWVMKDNAKLTFPKAHQILFKRLHPIGKSNNKKNQVKAERPPVEVWQADQSHCDALRQVVDYYQHTLQETPLALEYLEKRKISGEALKVFKLGYADGSFPKVLPSRRCQEGQVLRGQLADVGILRKATGYEHFRGCLVVPVSDKNEVITEVYGRKIKSSNKDINHLYLPGQHRGVWNPEGFEHNELLLCESLIDALTLWSLGFHNVSTCYGVNGFTSDIRETIISSGVQSVIFAFDADEAGHQKAETHAKWLLARGTACYRLSLPPETDVNAFVVEESSAAKKIQELILNAESMGMAESKKEEQLKEKTRDKPSLFTLAAQATQAIVGDQVEVEMEGDDMMCRLSNRLYRVRQFKRNLSPGTMKINLLMIGSKTFYQDTLDLCQDRPRESFAKRGAERLGLSEEVLQNDLGKLLLKLETLQKEYIADRLKPKETKVVLTEAEKKEAMAFLKDPKLADQILADFKACGMVGEETNKLIAYLSVVSRKLIQPLPIAVIIQSMSASGKTALMDAVLSFMPEEEVEKYSAMTGQSLFYMGEKNLKHKILAIVEEEGAERASYPLKLLQSEGELHIASTGKDPKTGDLGSRDYHVKGPVMIILTTTAVELDEELQNRCIILTVDESRAQTRAIHQIQRRSQTLDGLMARTRFNQVRRKHQNAQRLLRPIQVVNPFSEQLTFRDDQPRMRRDNMKYLTLIATVTLMHQYQRPLKQKKEGTQVVQYIETTLEDIEFANELANQILGRTLDELPPQTRKLLNLTYKMVLEIAKRDKSQPDQVRFSRRDLREYSRWGHTQIKIHMQRLEEFEYLLTFKGHRGQSFVYECLYNGQGQQNESFFMGLVPAKELNKSVDASQKRQSGRGET